MKETSLYPNFARIQKRRGIVELVIIELRKFRAVILDKEGSYIFNMRIKSK